MMIATIIGKIRANRDRCACSKGMTLVEVIISMAIIAVVATIVIGIFFQVLRFQELSREHADETASIEEQIAGFGAPAETQSLPGGGINLGGYVLPAETQTYKDGRGSYTILDGSTAPQVVCWEYGDGAPTANGSIDTGANGTDGTPLPFTVLMKGTYKIEVWGAQGDGSGSGSDWHGAYIDFQLPLDRGDALSLGVGGLGQAGSEGGASTVAMADGTMLVSAGGGDGMGGSKNSTIKPSIVNATLILGTSQMPDPLNPGGATITGKSGGGYIRITYLG